VFVGGVFVGVSAGGAFGAGAFVGAGASVGVFGFAGLLSANAGAASSRQLPRTIRVIRGTMRTTGDRMPEGSASSVPCAPTLGVRSLDWRPARTRAIAAERAADWRPARTRAM
jgi:hypothetical protein